MMTLIGNSPPDAHITTLDIMQHEQRIAFQDTAYRSRITSVVEGSAAHDFAPYKGAMDFVFVDAGHNYESMVIESARSFEMLAPGGVILWHDYPHFSGVKKALDEIGQQRQLVHLEGTRLAFYRGDR